MSAVVFARHAMTPAERLRVYGQRYEIYAPQHYAGLAAQRQGDCKTALEFWSLSQKDYKDAWQRYLRFVSFGGQQSFKELCAAAGIDDPFGEHALNGVARTANAWLDSNG